MRKKWFLRALCGLAACFTAFFTAFGFASCFGIGGGGGGEVVAGDDTLQLNTEGMIVEYYQREHDGKIPTKIVIPSEIDGKKVIGIAEDVFNNHEKLETVIIADGMTIGKEAFYSCDNLKNVTIGDNAIIGESAFLNCKNLKNVTIGKNAKIGLKAFGNTSCCESINGGAYIGNYLIGVDSGFAGEFAIANGTLEIAEGAFSECANLTGVSFPDSLTAIGDFAFKDCTGLTSVSIPERVTRIGYAAFQFCENLTSVTIGKGLKEVGEYAFNGCWNVTSVYYTGDLASWCRIEANSGWGGIDSELYISGKKIEGELIIPNGVTRIGSGVFDFCKGLTSVSIPNSVTSIGDNAFLSCSDLTSVSIPNSVKEIGLNAFFGCGLVNVTLPNGLTHIANGAFSSCSDLTSVVIPKSVTSIGEFAFGSCIRLAHVYYGGTPSDRQEVYVHPDSGIAENKIYYYVENEADVPTDGGKYWRYVDGVPTIWEH